jgi:type II secretory pathway component GspD/PulD (secretin)
MSLQGGDSIENLVNPIFNSREAETSVTVPDGDTLVIGGLRMVRHITRERKVPGLGDVKWLEWLFKNQRSQRQLSDLYFFVTPRIIQE